MAKIPAISAAEWKVMRRLWAKAPQPACDLVQALARTERWHPNTVKTLLSRLVKKKAAAAQRYKNLNLYRPLISEEQCVRAESDSFLDRLFGGSVKPLLVHFARRQKLTPQDLEELKRMLELKD